MKYKYLICSFIIAICSCNEAISRDASRIDDYLKECYRNNVIPGFSVVVIKNNHLYFCSGYGFENREQGMHYSCQSVTGIGSITKSFTALAVMQLAEAGTINLDAPVTQYLPWFRTANKDKSDRITVRMLLNNTSGLHSISAVEHDLSENAIEKMTIDLKGTYLSRNPGTSYEYSNTAFAVAGLIVQAVSGKSYARYMNEFILEPLHMAHTSFVPCEISRKTLNQGNFYGISGAIPARNEPESESGEYIPAGSMATSTSADMANYLMVLLNKGEFEGKHIIGEKSLAQMWTEQVKFPGLSIKEGGDGTDFSYGLGWMISRVDGREVIHHGGSTGKASSMTMLDRKSGIAVSILMNIDISFIDRYRYSTAFSIANNILHLAAGEPITDYGNPLEPDPTLNSFEINEDVTDKYTGDYFLMSGGDNFVFYNVNLKISRGKDKSLIGTIARKQQITEEFKVDFISSANAVSRNIGNANPIQFRLTPSGDVTGLIFRGMEFEAIRHDSHENWKKKVMQAEKFSLDIPSGWSSTWKNNKLYACDPAHPETSISVYVIKDAPGDLTGLVLQELNGSDVAHRGMEHNEMFAGRNWKEITLVTVENLVRNQWMVALTKGEDRNCVIVIRTPDGKMTETLQQLLIPLFYSIQF